MSDVNKAILIGHLGRDAEVRETPSGVKVVGFSLATTARWKNKDGQKQEKTSWHRIVAWHKEHLAPYLTKGKQVYVEGTIETRDYEDKDSGKKLYVTEIIANEIQLLGSAERGEGAERPVATKASATAGVPTKPAPSHFPRAAVEPPEAWSDDIAEDEVPF